MKLFLTQKMFSLCGAFWVFLGAAFLGSIITCAASTNNAIPASLGSKEKSWRFTEGDWHVTGNALEQRNPSRYGAAILKKPAFADCTISVEFNIVPEGNGVRAAAILFHATGTLTYYWLHLDSKNNQAILVRTTPGNNWIEIGRRHVELTNDTWHTAKVECRGESIRAWVDGKDAIDARDAHFTAGRVGLGTSQGHVLFRDLKIEGKEVKMKEPLKEESPPYQVISLGEAAGPYQAFPDVCRLKNGDLLCVFYAGYGHISLPNKEWLKGGRICMVRSKDEGKTWSNPEILFDDEVDNRDPHIAQMSDGTVICSFFSYPKLFTQIVRSRDGGKTWDTVPQTLVEGWAVSAPVRELRDGTYILGVYFERDGKAWGGVVRSTDRGKTWSEPIGVGKESGAYLDAETDIIQLKDETLFAALRSSSVNMYFATSKDLGLTWSPAQDIGFKGHAPHLTRLKTGEILMTHRVPATSLHVSRDECNTWEGPYVLDSVGGAYPSTVELKDGTVLAIYYEEGEGSAIRALRFRLKNDGIEPLRRK